MTFFERLRRTPGAVEQQSKADGLGASKTSGDVAERRRDYAYARLNELTPDIRAQTRLEMRLQAAQEALGLARESEARMAQLQTLRARLHARPGEQTRAPARQPDAPALAREAEEIERELAVLVARIATKEDELKVRFGLSV
jgi:hypothetical protein